MKTFLPFDTMTLHCDSGSRHDFPRLARESGFAFNLYRGRVDWSKIGAVDVDKVVRERDLETLEDVLSNVMSCSLSSEYDLKVLDPNFIKIFQLAQLGADFLLYCRNYLDHCVTVMQEQLRVALQEIEHLQKLKLQNADEITALQKKLKAKSTRSRNNSPVPIFKCSGCEKAFVGEQYLLAHQQRRHPELPREVDNFRQQVHELQDRLRATEDALKLMQNCPVPDVATLQAMLQSELQKMKSTITSTQSSTVEISADVSPSVSSNQPVQQEPKVVVVPENVEIQDKTTPVSESSEQLKQNYESAQATLLARVEQQNGEIKALREQLQEQHKAYELVMQRRLEELQLQHRADLDDLRLSITKSRGSGDHIAVASPVSATIAIDGKTQSSYQQSSHQAWENPLRNTDSDSKQNFVDKPSPSLPSPSTSVVESTKISTVTPSTVESKQVRAKEESVLQEEYVSPTDQESSESSSDTSSPEPVHTDSTDRRITPEKINFTDEVSTKKDELTHSISMYGKSSSSSSGSSETSSSSYDSDSQSSNNEQHQITQQIDASTSRVQLTPQVLTGLKEDLLGLLNRRLRELGVDPEWNGLPLATFNSNMATVKHHQNIAAKSQNSYFDIQEALLKEIDKRVAERLKSQQAVPSSSGIKKKRASGSFSIFARIKSHVKNKLSHSGHSSPVLSHPRNSDSNTKRAELVENVYSEEPSTSQSKSPHDYEVIQKTTLSEADASEALSHDLLKDSHSGTSNPSGFSIFSSQPINLTETIYENTGEKVNPSTSDINTSAKVYSRSMYANLSRAEIEVEKKESAPGSPLKQPAQLQTSTPIKSSLQSSVQSGVKKPNFITSDVESISELESDLNDIMENTNETKVAPLKTRPHTSLTTAELLANVAKFRQSSGQVNSSQSVVKSNLKSSLSTGNIMKKKVMFRDEKDGFDTIELGPAHSSHESLTPQRSLSENSLPITYNSPPNSDRPVPHPRNSLAPATAPLALTSTVNNDSDGDWDWDKESTETLAFNKIEGESNKGSGRPSSGISEDSGWRTISLMEKPGSADFADVSRVSDKVKNLERMLQKQTERPLFGINTAGPKLPEKSNQGRFSSITPSSTNPSTVTSIQSKSLHEDNLLDLLLDDISSS